MCIVVLFFSLIRDSAPHINSVVIVGCIIMLVGCYLLGIDSNNPPVSQYEKYVNEEDKKVPQDVITLRDDRYAVVCNVSARGSVTIVYILSLDRSGY